MLCNFFGDSFRPRYHHHRRAYASLPDSWGWDIPEPQFSPDCDVIETKDAYVLTMELPGISKEDIKAFDAAVNATNAYLSSRKGD